ncbi:MAG TPA: hypothetical protein PK609_02830 [Candidatus Paceibacterota bacterium]|nr:hypothetical protein [Candidatus Paceibacterota bacterium]
MKRQQLEGLRKLLKETESNTDLPEEKEVIIQLLNTIIRSNELILRSEEYLSSGFNLGYFLIQSQRIEKTVSGIIDSGEKLRAMSSKTKPKDINLNIPLGQLTKLLSKYIEGDAVFVPLKEFNDYRKVTIHRLSDDFTRPLSEIEASIAADYPFVKINNLQSILMEAQRRISVRTLEFMPEGENARTTGTKLAAEMERVLNLNDLNIKLLNS